MILCMLSKCVSGDWIRGGESTLIDVFVPGMLLHLYSAQGSISIAGECIKWLRDSLGLIPDSKSSGL
jgi:glycerol kinase